MSKLNKPNSSFTFSLETPSFSSSTLEGYLKSIFGSESTNSLPDMFTSEIKQQQLNIGNSGNSKQETPQELPSSSSSSSSYPLEKEKQQYSTLNPSHVNLNLSNHTEVHHGEMSGAPPVVVSITSNLNPNTTTTLEKNSSSSTSSSQVVETSSEPINSTTGAIITTGETSELIPVPRGQSYVDITEYLNMPQSEAAKKLGIPASTLSKRWKEAVRKRKWPFRMVCKIDKEIMTLLHNVPQGSNAPPLPSEIEGALGGLLRRRQEELRSVVIRL